MLTDRFNFLHAFRIMRFVGHIGPSQVPRIVGSVTILRYLAIAVVLLFTAACSGSQALDLSVDRAIATRDLAGNSEIEVFLTAESSRKFANFTSKALGQLVEFRFLNQTLAVVRLRTPTLDGHFPIGTSLGEDKARDVATQISSNRDKLVVRLLDDKE